MGHEVAEADAAERAAAISADAAAEGESDRRRGGLVGSPSC